MNARREQSIGVPPEGGSENTIDTPLTVLAAFPQAILDIFDHAAWLTDSAGQSVVLNDRARSIVSQGFRILSAPLGAPFIHDGNTFCIIRRELNHGTGWYLNEMRFAEDAACVKLRDSTSRLAAALDQPVRRTKPVMVVAK